MANKRVQTIISEKRKNYLLNHNISLYRTAKLNCTTNFYTKLNEKLTFKLSLLSLNALPCLIFWKLTFMYSKISPENVKHNYLFFTVRIWESSYIKQHVWHLIHYSKIFCITFICKWGTFHVKLRDWIHSLVVHMKILYEERHPLLLT